MKQWAIPALEISLTLGWVLATAVTRAPGLPPTAAVPQGPLRTRLTQGLHSIRAPLFLPSCGWIKCIVGCVSATMSLTACSLSIQDSSRPHRASRPMYSEISVDEETLGVSLLGEVQGSDRQNGSYFVGEVRAGKSLDHVLFEGDKTQVLETLRMSTESTILYRQRNQLIVDGEFGEIWLQRHWFLDRSYYPQASIESKLFVSSGSIRGDMEELPLTQVGIDHIPKITQELIGLMHVVETDYGSQIDVVTYTESGIADRMGRLPVYSRQTPDPYEEKSSEVIRHGYLGLREGVALNLHVGLGFPFEIGPDTVRDDIMAWVGDTIAFEASVVERHALIVASSGLEVIHVLNSASSGERIERLEFRELKLDSLMDRLALR